MNRATPHLSLAALALAAASLLVALPARAQGTQEQQDACAPDAFKFCQATIPDIPKTEACMKAHFAQLSHRCQLAFGDVTGAPKGPPADTARGEETAPPPPVAVAPRARIAMRPASTPRPSRRRALTPRRSAAIAATA